MNRTRFDAHTLRSVRYALGMSQYELSRRSGVQQAIVAALEIGQNGESMTVSQLLALAQALNIAPGHLFTPSQEDTTRTATTDPPPNNTSSDATNPATHQHRLTDDHAALGRALAHAPLTRGRAHLLTGLNSNQLDAQINALRQHLELVGITIHSDEKELALHPHGPPPQPQDATAARATIAETFPTDVIRIVNNVHATGTLKRPTKPSIAWWNAYKLLTTGRVILPETPPDDAPTQPPGGRWTLTPQHLPSTALRALAHQRDDIKPWPTSTPTRQEPTTTTAAAIRLWAKSVGIHVAQQGTLPNHVTEAWRTAHHHGHTATRTLGTPDRVIRAWAKANKLPVKNRGTIPFTIVNAWRAANDPGP